MWIELCEACVFMRMHPGKPRTSNEEKSYLNRIYTTLYHITTTLHTTIYSFHIKFSKFDVYNTSSQHREFKCYATSMI